MGPVGFIYTIKANVWKKEVVKQTRLDISAFLSILHSHVASFSLSVSSIFLSVSGSIFLYLQCSQLSLSPSPRRPLPDPTPCSDQPLPPFLRRGVSGSADSGVRRLAPRLRVIYLCAVTEFAPQASGDSKSPPLLAQVTALPPRVSITIWSSSELVLAATELPYTPLKRSIHFLSRKQLKKIL